MPHTSIVYDFALTYRSLVCIPFVWHRIGSIFYHLNRHTEKNRKEKKKKCRQIHMAGEGARVVERESMYGISECSHIRKDIYTKYKNTYLENPILIIIMKIKCVNFCYQTVIYVCNNTDTHISFSWPSNTRAHIWNKVLNDLNETKIV